MEKIFSELIDLITRETAEYGRLLELSRDVKETLVKNHVPELDKVVTKQKSVLKKINELEEKREYVFRLFSEESGIKEPSMRDIIEAAHGADKEKLLVLSAALEETAAELHRLNVLNKTLIEAQITYVSLCVNLVTGPFDTIDTYSNSGRINGENRTRYRLIDQSV